MNVKAKVLEILRSKEWVSVEDFEREFPPRTEGHMSWGQRKRELHKEFVIEKRKKAGCTHTWEYHLIESKSPPPLKMEKEQYCFV